MKQEFYTVVNSECLFRVEDMQRALRDRDGGARVAGAVVAVKRFVIDRKPAASTPEAPS